MNILESLYKKGLEIGKSMIDEFQSYMTDIFDMDIVNWATEMNIPIVEVGKPVRIDVDIWHNNGDKFHIDFLEVNNTNKELIDDISKTISKLKYAVLVNVIFRFKEDIPHSSIRLDKAFVDWCKERDYIPISGGGRLLKGTVKRSDIHPALREFDDVSFRRKTYYNVQFFTNRKEVDIINTIKNLNEKYIETFEKWDLFSKKT